MKVPIQGLLQESAVFEPKPIRRSSWYDYNWDWVLISLLALVLLAGIVPWTRPNRPQTASISDATTGQSTRPNFTIFPN
jgi:hypothetical protein